MNDKTKLITELEQTRHKSYWSTDDHLLINRVISALRAPEAADAGAVALLQAEVNRLTKRLDLLAVGFDVPDGGRYIADWQTRIDKYKRLSASPAADAGITAPPTMREFVTAGITNFKEHELREIVATFCKLPGIAPSAPPAASADAVREALKPFADAARNFTCTIGPDGIDDGVTIVAQLHGRPEREAMLSSADFSNAARALTAPVAGADAGMREPKP